MPPASSRYKRIALSNTTLGMLTATINASPRPDVQRGIRDLRPVLHPAVGDLDARHGGRLVPDRDADHSGRRTIWSYLKLRELGIRKPARLDWWGNVTFAAGLIAVLVGISYGIQPYGGHTMGWTSPLVLGPTGGGLVVLALFGFIQTRVADPMFRLALFRIRPFTAGNLAALLSGLGRGGLMFILIIWLQGIHLPMHGYAFTATPLWAGIAMLPLTIGFLAAGPVSGWLSVRPRPERRVRLRDRGLPYRRRRERRAGRRAGGHRCPPYPAHAGGFAGLSRTSGGSPQGRHPRLARCLARRAR